MSESEGQGCETRAAIGSQRSSATKRHERYIVLCRVRFMFDCEGRLLQANRRAIQHCKQQLSGEKLTMWSLFKLGQYASKSVS